MKRERERSSLSQKRLEEGRVCAGKAKETIISRKKNSFFLFFYKVRGGVGGVLASPLSKSIQTSNPYTTRIKKLHNAGLLELPQKHLPRRHSAAGLAPLPVPDDDDAPARRREQPPLERRAARRHAGAPVGPAKVVQGPVDLEGQAQEREYGGIGRRRRRVELFCFSRCLCRRRRRPRPRRRRRARAQSVEAQARPLRPREPPRRHQRVHGQPRYGTDPFLADAAAQDGGERGDDLPLQRRWGRRSPSLRGGPRRCGAGPERRGAEPGVLRRGLEEGEELLAVPVSLGSLADAG